MTNRIAKRVLYGTLYLAPIITLFAKLYTGNPAAFWVIAKVALAAGLALIIVFSTMAGFRYIFTGKHFNEN